MSYEEPYYMSLERGNPFHVEGIWWVDDKDDRIHQFTSEYRIDVKLASSEFIRAIRHSK